MGRLADRLRRLEERRHGDQEIRLRVIRAGDIDPAEAAELENAGKLVRIRRSGDVRAARSDDLERDRV